MILQSDGNIPLNVRSAAFVQSELHDFAAEMLVDIRTCNVLDKLEDLFDVAEQASGSAALAAGNQTAPNPGPAAKPPNDLLAEMLERVRIG